jgi:hypothetical protein
MEVTVKVLATFGASFLFALAGILLAMLAFSLFGSHSLNLIVAIGMATGVALAGAIRAARDLSLHASAVLFGILSWLGSMAGHWLSNG